mmetsp:Transcript_4905/g.12679  ORF Transcript_4905/g.12679 Transcript_4905/m.12679 type:complete len:206 (+) Transcript_4905:978-1595(+)
MLLMLLMWCCRRGPMLRPRRGQFFLFCSSNVRGADHARGSMRGNTHWVDSWSCSQTSSLSRLGSRGDVVSDCDAKMAALSWLATFWRCAGSRRCPTGDPALSGNASSAIVSSSSSSSGGLSSVRGANSSSANARASSILSSRISSTSRCSCSRKKSSGVVSRISGSRSFVISIASMTAPCWIACRTFIREPTVSSGVSGISPHSS